jgi:hypothetical protein
VPHTSEFHHDTSTGGVLEIITFFQVGLKGIHIGGERWHEHLAVGAIEVVVAVVHFDYKVDKGDAARGEQFRAGVGGIVEVGNMIASVFEEREMCGSVG